MPGQLTYLTLPVADLPSAARFYERVFGWPAPRSVPNALFYELPGLTLALMERAAFNQFTGTADDSAPTGALVSWNVPRRRPRRNHRRARRPALGDRLESASSERDSPVAKR
jgi:catechol 2,3-dioxygenase-like lactoylglutathione lyase family enzyme